MPRWLDQGRARSLALDHGCARALHRVADVQWLHGLMALASRLGDAPLWVLLALLLLATGDAGARRTATLLLVLGGVNLAIYWALKHSTRRERPFRCCSGIRECVRAPDAFSFPSGHALHATAFATLLSTQYPAASGLLWGFAALVATSRVVLGVHFPSDVLAGAAIGAGTAALLVLLA